MSLGEYSFINKFIFLFAIILLCCSEFSFALSKTPMFSSSSVYRYNYGILMMTGQGYMGNGLATAPYRKMGTAQVQAFLGFRYNYFRYSVTAEYANVVQLTEPAEVGNTNMAGVSFSYGPKIEYYTGSQSIGVVYRLKSVYDLRKLDINNNKQYYASEHSFEFQYTQRVYNKLGIAIGLAQERFDQSLTDGSVKWDRLSIGVIFSNFDKHPYPM